MKLDSVYRGDPNQKPKLCVSVDGAKLRLRLDLRKHSPDGFAWGYSGSGPAQLALAILCDFLGDDEQAQRAYQHFKAEVVSRLEQNKPWELTGRQIAESQCVKSVLANEVVEP